jgi:hypothetical protein
VIGYGGRRAAGGRPQQFPHDNFSSVYRIFTKLGHMIPLWKGKNHLYFGVNMSKVKVTVTINIIVDNRIVSARELLFCILDLYQTWPLDSPVEGKESYLFWGY